MQAKFDSDVCDGREGRTEGVSAPGWPERRKASIDPVNSRPSPMLPAKLGRYQIKRELGRGAMGVVYRARDPNTGRTLALKLSLDAEASRLERFQREGEITAALRHPSIVTIQGVYACRSSAFARRSSCPSSETSALS